MKLMIVIALVFAPASALADRIDDFMRSATASDRATAYLLFATQEDLTSDDYLWISDKFAACNALTWVIADLTATSEDERENSHFRQVGNGANIAGLMFNALAGYSKGLYEGTVESHMAYWRSRIALAPQALDDEMESTASICAEINPLQSSLVAEMRKDLYRNTTE